MDTLTPINTSIKSIVFELITNNEPISYTNIFMFLDECYSSNDIDSVKKFLHYSYIFDIFRDENTYYYNRYEVHSIMKKIALFNNIEIIDIIMYHTNDYTDNYKQQDAGTYITAILYKYNFDLTAEKLVNKYNLDKGEIIIKMYRNQCDIDKTKHYILSYSDTIQAPNRRDWLLRYCARNDDIDMIKFLQEYYEYTSDDIFNILFNFSKSLSGSKELYIYIFNNYIDIIKHDKNGMHNLINKLFYAEHYELIYFIVSKIDFTQEELVNIFTGIFSYEYFFSEIIENITNIMLNVCNMKPIELKNIYSQINNQNVHQYIQMNL